MSGRDVMPSSEPPEAPLSMEGSVIPGRSALRYFYGMAERTSLLYDPNKPAWMDKGLCQSLDPDIWFPAKGASADEAKRICNVCPVREECLEHAIVTPELDGIWGGLSAKDRNKMRRKRGLLWRDGRGRRIGQAS